MIGQTGGHSRRPPLPLLTGVRYCRDAQALVRPRQVVVPIFPHGRGLVHVNILGKGQGPASLSSVEQPAGQVATLNVCCAPAQQRQDFCLVAPYHPKPDAQQSAMLIPLLDYLQILPVNSRALACRAPSLPFVLWYSAIDFDYGIVDPTPSVRYERGWCLWVP